MGSLIGRSSERLRSVIVVMRHGDRRPKEKMKFKTKHPDVLAYFDGVNEAEAKLKTPEEMMELKEKMEKIVKEYRTQIAELEAGPTGSKAEEKITGLKQELLSTELLIPVLEMTDRFSGLERKVQLKVVKWK